MDIVRLFETRLLLHFRHTGYAWNSDDIENMRLGIGVLDELGQLMLHKGAINGTELFSPAYYRQCIRAYSAGGSPEHSPYGLGWWIDEGGRYVYAAGFGGQILLISPENKLSVAILSDMDRPHLENRELVQRLAEI